mmetsp:Transcript_41919/g.82178  ORF Transcript_41919/g.82178 Transcript_41919/m.82178 type:complete len:470 (+) Transcript_41919:161-1570(+)
MHAYPAFPGRPPLLHVAAGLGKESGAGLAIEKEAVDLPHVLFRAHRPPARLREYPCRGEHLHRVPETRPCPDLPEQPKRPLVHLRPLHLRPDLHNGRHLLHAVGHGPHDEHPVQQIHGHAVGREHVRPANLAHPPVRREDDDGGERALEALVEKGETLDVEHVHLVDEEHPRHELRDALVDVPVDHPVDLRAQFFRNLRLFGLAHGRHEARHVRPALRPRVRHVEVVQGHVLHHLPFFVHLPLGQGHVLLRLQVEFGGVRVAPSHAFDGAGVGLHVDDVAHRHVLLGERLVDGGVEAERLGAPGRPQPDDHVGDGAAVAPQRVLRLLRRQLRDLPLVHLFALLDAEADGPPEILREDLRLFHLAAEHLAADHGTEGHLRTQLLADPQGERRFARARGARQQERPSRHFAGPNQVHHHAACLTGAFLSDEAGGHRGGQAGGGIEAQTADVGVGGDALGFGRALDLLDLHI